jgi:preprotein translocase subunit SecD
VRSRLAGAIVGLVAAFAATGSVHAEREVVAYRVAAWEGSSAVPAESVRAAAAIVAKRFKHAGLAATADVAKAGDAIEVRVGVADDEAQVRRLAERRGLIEFRVRAETAVEDKWRDKRLLAGEAPPADLEWKEQEDNVLQVLVETPEKAAAAKLAALQKKDPPADAATLKGAQEAVDAAIAASRFTNADIASASVQRSQSWGAQGLMRIAVRFEFRDDRKAAFEKFTGDHKGRALCVIVDGKVHVAPVIGAALPGMGELTGSGAGYSETDAREMAAIFESGALPCRLVAGKDK